ncbi:MAG: amidohydrolase family protein [Chloroflexota bacterium]
MPATVIDGDGHIFEDNDNILRRMPPSYKLGGINPIGSPFPPLDDFHFLVGTTPGMRSGRGAVGVEGWLRFLDDTAIDMTVLYPTFGLGSGHIPYPEWAVHVSRAYNDWLYETYLARDPRFKGVALIPMQEPEAAVAELRRAVNDLGMCGAMLPSNGLKAHLGSKEYWPVYAEAERLGCCLGVHGGAHNGWGMDHLSPYPPVHSIGHPHGQLMALGGMIFNGVFDKYPGLKVGFMEAGTAWFLLALERFGGSYETNTPHEPRGYFFEQGEDESVRDVLLRHVKAGRIYIGCEGDELTLTDLIRRTGSECLLFSSDFPHEPTTEMCQREIEELRDNPGLSEADKSNILATNAERFYRIRVPVAQ